MRKQQTENLFQEEIEEISFSHVIRLAFETAADTEFDYAVADTAGTAN